MKKFLLLLFAFVGLGFWSVNAQNGTLTFGSIADGTVANIPNTGFSAVRVGTGGGVFTIVNPGTVTGTGAILKGTAPTSTSVNSVGIQSAQFGSTATTFSIAFDLYLDGGSAGTWYFFAGNGASFETQSSGFTGNQVFIGLRWIFGATNAITTSNRAAAAWVAMTAGTFAQQQKYLVQIVGNNTASTVNYGPRTLAANSYDLYLNGTLVGADMAKGSLAAGTVINAFRFYGENSAGNVATIYLDNIKWWNSAVNPSNAGFLPVELKSLTANASGNNVKLNWSTATEQNNLGFEVERSLNVAEKNWVKVGFVAGNGTTNKPNTYSYTDGNVNAGSYSYRLKQVDKDGAYKYSSFVNVDITAPSHFALEQNYPNPFNPSTVISYSLPTESNVSLKVFNALGQEVKNLESGVRASGLHTFNLNASELTSGIYYYTLKATSTDGKSNYSQTKKMLLIK